MNDMRLSFKQDPTNDSFYKERLQGFPDVQQVSWTDAR